MHVFYGIHTLTAWLGHEERRIKVQTYSIKIRGIDFKSKLKILSYH